jgi:dienelactone hydrolase
MRARGPLLLCAVLATTGCRGQKGTENPASVAAAITTREVSYTSGSTPLKGFIAYPAGAEKRPGVLIVHEWWGLNDYVRKRATQLAQQGYVAMAIDMYGEGKHTSHPEQAQAFIRAAMSNAEEAKARFKAAQDLLGSDPRADRERLAVIGYCAGGAIALNMARAGDNELDLVASFHGNLATQSPMAKGAYKGKIFVAQGGADPFVPAEQVAAFKKEMDTANADLELVEYPGAKHGFTNPEATESGRKSGLPLAYDAEADQKSWQRLIELLEAL